MKTRWNWIVALTAVLGSSCINWEQADASWCNDATLEQRHMVCDIGDTASVGAYPDIESARRFGGAGNETVVAMAATSGGVFIGGAFDAPVTLGAPLLSAGGLDGYLAKLDGEGVPTHAVSFGGIFDDRVVDVEAGTGDALFFAARYTTTTSAPGGATLSSSGVVDSFVMKLDSNLQPLAMLDFAASTSGRVEVMDIDHRDGRVAVTGRVHGLMTVGPHRIGNGGPAAFVVVYDEDLNYQWHALADGCADAVGDSVALGASGEVYFALRAMVQTDCPLLNETLVALPPPPPPFLSLPWHDVLVRIDFDGTTASIPLDWMVAFPASVRNPFNQPTGTHPGFEAPNQVVVLNDEVAFLFHRWGFTQSRKPGADIAFLRPSNAQPVRDAYTFGRATAQNGSEGQDMRAKMWVDGQQRLWVYGEFTHDYILLDPLRSVDPFLNARHGFVRVYDHADPSRDWARVFVGHTPNKGAVVGGVHVDALGRTWAVGNFETTVTASNHWLDSQAVDGFLYIMAP